MADVLRGAERLLKPFELGLRVAQGRRRANVSQAAFAQKLGVSRKTVSDLERGVAEHVSLKTAMAALSLAGFALYCAQRRPPTMEEIMARRAADRARADALLNSRAATSSSSTPHLLPSSIAQSSPSSAPPPAPRSSTKSRRRNRSV
jgi:DNA-binding XRE family transcriptional regulator